MRVSDILKVKGNTLFTVTPDKPLREAVDTMAEHDIGSLVVMEYGDLVGMLTFREIIQRLHVNGGAIGDVQVRKVMDEPLTCTPETDVNEVRRMMLERHARYLPVLDKKVLMGVISFYDVAKTVVEAQSFENRMLKAYIRDWPESEAEAQKRDTSRPVHRTRALPFGARRRRFSLRRRFSTTTRGPRSFAQTMRAYSA
jgi:CBS domain-containing protein